MPADIAAAITTLRDDPERRRKMGETGRRRASLYTEQAYYERYVQLIEQESIMAYEGGTIATRADLKRFLDYERAICSCQPR